jgi:hypothetical protein
VQRLRDLAVVLDKSAVKVAHTQERLHASYYIRLLPCFNHFDLRRINADALSADNES